MSAVVALLTALGPGLIDLIEAAAKDDFDEEAERQALLKIQRSIHDARLARALEAAQQA